MGIVMYPLMGTYFPVASAVSAEQLNRGGNFFVQGKRADVSEYDLRQVRDSNRKGRSECEVLHAKASASISFNGNSYAPSGEGCTGAFAYAWWTYPNVTVIIASEREYHGPGWWSWTNWGTSCRPQVHVLFYSDDDTHYARVTHGAISWGPRDYENPVEWVNAYYYGDMYFGGIWDLLVRHQCIPTVVRMPFYRNSSDTVAVPSDKAGLQPFDWAYMAQVIKEEYHDVGQGSYRCDEASVSSVDPEFSWLLLENGYPNGYGSLNFVESEHYRQLMLQHAYLDALSSVEHAWDNGVSNVGEFIKFFVNLIKHHKVEVPKNWKDGWLSYRYVYSTTKLDQEELASDLQSELRKMLQEGKRYVKVHGSYNMDIAGTTITCRVSVFLKNRVYDFLDKCLIWLEEFGLKPDLYLAWDMTPYSFIVDWFLPIGNTLNAVDAAEMYNGADSVYDIGPITYSFSYTQNIRGSNVHNYSRGILDSLPIQAFYWFVEPSQSSARTWGKRLIDTFALFT